MSCCDLAGARPVASDARICSVCENSPRFGQTRHLREAEVACVAE